MKTLLLTNYQCDECKMPSLPGVCELCRTRVKRESKPSIWTRIVRLFK